MQLVNLPTPARVRSRWTMGRDVWSWLRVRSAYLTAMVIGIVFWLAPWPFAQKVHAILHGICAQRLSHSFLLGGEALPFDARMTGIYGGFLVTFVYLIAMGRTRAWAMPPVRVLVVLAAFVLMLAIDGSSSTLRDLGLWYPYDPDNRLRLVTGLLTGMALAALLCYLLATTLWRKGDWENATVVGLREVGLLVVMQAPFALLVLSGMGVLYTPIATLLVLAAVGVFLAMAVAMLTMARRRDQSYQSFTELQWPLAAGLILALAVIGALAGGRFFLEWWFAIPPML